MKIGIFTNNYLPNPYGVSGSIESFRKEFEKSGHEVYVFAPKWKGYIDKNPNACPNQNPAKRDFGRVFRYPSIDVKIKIRFPLAIPYSSKIDKILEKLDLDIIHSQHPNLLGNAARRWAKKKNIPLIFTWHTLYDQYAHFVPFIPRKLAAWFAIRSARNYANRCDAVIAPTKSVIGIIKKWGVTNKKKYAISTGVEENIFSSPDRDRIRKKYNIRDDETLLVVVSRLTAEKNIEFLLDSAIEIMKSNPKTKFLICGEGNLERESRETVKKKGLDAKVIFAGFVHDDVKKDYYAAGDIFIYASKSETQGMILTEAMYAGLPIVAVRATGVENIVEDGRTGFLVSENIKEFQETMEKLIRDKDLRNKFSAEAKRIAREKYTSEVCAKKILDVYAETISNHR
jgi:1,2-diacylglycerol 3-alpha-glucosyltransferase